MKNLFKAALTVLFAISMAAPINAGNEAVKAEQQEAKTSKCFTAAVITAGSVVALAGLYAADRYYNVVGGYVANNTDKAGNYVIANSKKAYAAITGLFMASAQAVEEAVESPVVEVLAVEKVAEIVVEASVELAPDTVKGKFKETLKKLKKGFKKFFDAPVN